MTKSEKIKNAKTAAHWIRDLKQTVTIVRTKKKIYTGRGEWYMVHEWNTTLDELRPFDLETFEQELGIEKHDYFSLAKRLTAAGFSVFDNDSALTIWNLADLRINHKANVEYVKVHQKRS